MTRFFLALIAVVSPLAMIPYAGEAQKPTPKKGDLPIPNQVYVKIILPIDPAKRDKDLPVVESWIAEQLKKRGQTKFTAATGWVPIAGKGEKLENSTEVWDGDLDGKSLGVCPVDGRISERANGCVKLFLDGNIGWKKVTVTLRDEPGTRAIAASEYLDLDTEERIPLGYVVVLIGPPLEKLAASSDHKK